MRTFAVEHKRPRAAARRLAVPRPRAANPRLAAQRMEIGRILHGPRVQTKLKVGAPDDAHEREADRVADQVMRMPEPQTTDKAPVLESHKDASIQRMCPECEGELRRQPVEEEEEEALRRQPVEEPEEEEQTLRRQALEEEEPEELRRQPEEKPEEEDETLRAKAAPGQTPAVTPGLETRVKALRGGGRPLPDATRAFFEPRFGHDFSRVRVHADARGAEAARAVNARAFTLGRDIAFGPVQYAPTTSAGRRLLAHELTHVVQQTGKKRSILTTPKSVSAVRQNSALAKEALQRQPQRRAIDYSQCAQITVSQQTRLICPPSVERAQQFNRLITELSQYQPRIRRSAVAFQVPEHVLTGVIYIEQLDRSAFGDWWGRLWGKRTVSLGLGQIQVRRAAELGLRSRDFQTHPLTDVEFEAIADILEDPARNIDLTAIEMRDNFTFYGRVPGKTDEDRWKFALARHKGGHGPVGSAQIRARQNGQNLNSWNDVSTHLSAEILNFVNEVWAVR